MSQCLRLLLSSVSRLVNVWNKSTRHKFKRYTCKCSSVIFFWTQINACFFNQTWLSLYFDFSISTNGPSCLAFLSSHSKRNRENAKLQKCLIFNRNVHFLLDSTRFSLCKYLSRQLNNCCVLGVFENFKRKVNVDLIATEVFLSLVWNDLTFRWSH